MRSWTLYRTGYAPVHVSASSAPEAFVLGLGRRYCLSNPVVWGFCMVECGDWSIYL